MLHILTLTYNGKSKLSALYPSLIASLSDVPFTWYIKDNNSADDSLATILSWNNKNVVAFPYAHNRDSFARGCNYLFDMANPADDDLVLLLNNDVLFKDKVSINKMMDILNNDPTIGAVGAKLNYPNGLIQHAGVIFGKQYQLPKHFRTQEREDENARQNREFQAVTGAVLLTRASLYRKAGKIDERLIWAFDDINYCLYLKYKLGKKIVYCGQTNITHEESATLRTNPVNKMFLYQNIHFMRNTWSNYRQIDEDQYTNDPSYKLYQGPNAR